MYVSIITFNKQVRIKTYSAENVTGWITCGGDESMAGANFPLVDTYTYIWR